MAVRPPDGDLANLESHQLAHAQIASDLLDQGSSGVGGATPARARMKTPKTPTTTTPTTAMIVTMMMIKMMMKTMMMRLLMIKTKTAAMMLIMMMMKTMVLS